MLSNYAQKSPLAAVQSGKGQLFLHIYSKCVVKFQAGGS